MKILWLNRYSLPKAMSDYSAVRARDDSKKGKSHA